MADNIDTCQSWLGIPTLVLLVLDHLNGKFLLNSTVESDDTALVLKNGP